MTATIEPQEKITVASFFAEEIDDTKDEISATIAALEAAGDDPEVAAALAIIRKAAADASQSLERAQLEKEIAADDAKLTEFQNALIAKKQRLAAITPKPEKATRKRRTPEEIEADKAAKAAKKGEE